MRITYFSDTPRLGGAEQFLADIVGGAHAAHHDVTVVSPQRFLLDFLGNAVPEARLIEAGGVDDGKARSLGGTITALAREAPALRRALQRTNAMLLHANNGGYPGSDLCRLALLVAKGTRIPLRLLTVNSAPLPRETSQAQLQAAVDRMLWKSVDAVHATTDFVEARLHETRGMPLRLCTHIPYGVAAPGGSDEAAERLRRGFTTAEPALVVGMISATADREKGHHVLLEALAQADTSVHAVVVGPNSDASLFALITALGLEERVTVVGPVASAEVGAYLRAIDLLVVPSTAFESLPLVVLEAMAAGKAVVASRLSGIPEAVIDGETGRLFTPGAVDELARLLHEARESPELVVRMGVGGRERWRERFSSQAMVEAMLRLYDTLAAKARESRTAA